MWQHLLLLANCNAEGDDGPFYNQNGIQAAAYEVDDKKRHFLKINKKEHKLCEGGSALCRLTSDIMLVLLYLAKMISEMISVNKKSELPEQKTFLFK